MSSSWMFGGDAQETSTQKPKKFLDRSWNDEGANAGLAIGAESDRETVFRNKRLAQQAYKDALNADRKARDVVVLENQENERQQAASMNLHTGGSVGGVSQIGQTTAVQPTSFETRSNVKQQLALSKLDIAAKIAWESDPTNSPRSRNVAQYEEDESASAFCIGESEAVVRRRKAEQKAAYLAQLDADTGNKRQSEMSSARGSARDWDYVSNGVTGLAIGLGKPSMDMSPSMKNLHSETKQAKQAAYRQLLADQITAGQSRKAAQKLAEMVDASEPLPYMRY